MYLVDTNILVVKTLSSYVKLTKKEKEILRFFKKISPSKLYISDFIITEFAIVTTKAAPKKYGIKDRRIIKDIICTTAQAVGNLLVRDANIIMPTYEELECAANIFLDNSKKGKAQDISFPDFLLVAMAKERGLVLLTADKALIQFSKQQGALVNRGK